jgi:hypothetical protein
MGSWAHWQLQLGISSATTPSRRVRHEVEGETSLSTRGVQKEAPDVVQDGWYQHYHARELGMLVTVDPSVDPDRRTQHSKSKTAAVPSSYNTTVSLALLAVR